MSDASFVDIPTTVFGNYAILGFKIDGNFAFAIDIESGSKHIGYKRFSWYG